jgi:hypothetical protein
VETKGCPQIRCVLFGGLLLFSYTRIASSSFFEYDLRGFRMFEKTPEREGVCKSQGKHKDSNAYIFKDVTAKTVAESRTQGGRSKRSGLI